MPGSRKGSPSNQVLPCRQHATQLQLRLPPKRSLQRHADLHSLIHPSPCSLPGYLAATAVATQGQRRAAVARVALHQAGAAAQAAAGALALAGAGTGPTGHGCMGAEVLVAGVALERQLPELRLATANPLRLYTARVCVTAACTCQRWLLARSLLPRPPPAVLAPTVAAAAVHTAALPRPSPAPPSLPSPAHTVPECSRRSCCPYRSFTSRSVGRSLTRSERWKSG